jgi:Maltose operon periplasmic protein precursor (MalM)
MKTSAIKVCTLCFAVCLMGRVQAGTQLESTVVQTGSTEVPATVVAQPAINPPAPLENSNVPVIPLSDNLNPVLEKKCWPQASEDKKLTKAGFVQSMIKITQASPKGVFKTGDSGFEVVVLPVYKKEYRFEISLVFDYNLRKQSEVLVPSVLIVDEKFCEITDFPKLKFTPTYGVFAGVEVEKAFIDVRDEKPKYALIYTDTSASNSEVNVTTDFGYGIQNQERFLRVSYGYTNVRINK